MSDGGKKNTDWWCAAGVMQWKKKLKLEGMLLSAAAYSNSKYTPFLSVWIKWEQQIISS